ncbi:hypothetical protein GCK32_002179, partial [Trichostrongylus colubriformis]
DTSFTFSFCSASISSWLASAGMPVHIPAASREASKLYCSLLKASKQGDRVVKPPERYSSMDWSTKPQRTTHVRAVSKRKKASCTHHNTSAYKEAAKVHRENVEVRGSEGEPYADEEEEEAVIEESNTNGMNVPPRSTHGQTLASSGRIGYQVDENANNQAFMPLQHQGTRAQQSSDIPQLPHDASNQFWRQIGGVDFDNSAGTSLQGATSLYNPFNQQANPYMALMAPPYRFQNTVPYYTPVTSYINNSFYNPLYPSHNFSSSPCQRYRERFITEVATSMLTTLIDKAASFECCPEHCPDMNSGASRSVSTATIPALQSSSLDRMAATASVHGIPRPEALYENCESA